MNLPDHSNVAILQLADQPRLIGERIDINRTLKRLCVHALRAVGVLLLVFKGHLVYDFEGRTNPGMKGETPKGQGGSVLIAASAE